MKATQLLHDLGQSLWLDNITRDLLDNGTLQRGVRHRVHLQDLRGKLQGPGAPRRYGRRGSGDREQRPGWFRVGAWQ